MRKGAGIAAPRLSNRSDVEIINQKPSQEPPNVASSNLGKENMTSVHSSLVNPIPLRFIPAITGYDSKNENSQLLTRPCPKLLKTLDNSILDALSIPYTKHNGAPSNSAEHAITPPLQIGYVASNSGQESADMHTNAMIEVPPQSLSSLKQISDGKKPCNEVMLPSREVSDSYATAKVRRAKISEGIKKFKDIVQSSDTSDKDNQDSILDDTIDYIKYLKLQLKVLSQSRLCGEFTPHPFIYLEGYGHYLLSQMVCNEPLEDMIGLLMEKSPQAAMELLESKGLTIMPRGLAYSLLNPSQGSLPQA